MIHASLTPFGRQPVTARLLAARTQAAITPDLPAGPLPGIDKWHVFNDLRDGRAAFGVTDRDLSVLYALLTFLPAKSLAEGADLIVFPSNASLSDRAHGMAESTLRRHLAALVAAGLIWRQDSPNGKRYAARTTSGEVVCTYGFDLRPLLTRAAEISSAAETARAQALALRRQREALVLKLRDAAKLLAYGRETVAADWDALEARLLPLRRALRRQMVAETLPDLLHDADEVLHSITAALSLPSPEMSATAAQNDRHHTNSTKDSSELEPCPEQGRAEASRPAPEPTALPLYLVLKACPDIAPYAKGSLDTWRDFVATAAFVRGMVGISVSAWEEAVAVMGPELAAIAVAAMLQRIAGITNPGGYLRALTTKAGTGAFSAGPMIMALLNGQGRGGKS